MQTTNLRWLIPSFHGDIQLTAKGSKTELRAFDLTGSEEEAMKVLRSRALKSTLTRGPWAREQDFLPLTSSAYRSSEGMTVTLDAKIADVQKVLAKALKPGRELVMVLKSKGAQVVEVSDVPEPTKVATEETKPKEAAAAATVGTTIAQPVKGCPMPNFPEADVRASRVLETFLEPDQIDDYRRTGAFVTRGADTGRRYLVCNRERPALMRESAGGRQLFDLDLNAPICVHDWAVPPPEEMLALHLCLSLPGRETRLLMLPEMDHELAMFDVDPRYRPGAYL